MSIFWDPPTRAVRSHFFGTSTAIRCSRSQIFGFRFPIPATALFLNSPAVVCERRCKMSDVKPTHLPDSSLRCDEEDFDMQVESSRGAECHNYVPEDVYLPPTDDESSTTSLDESGAACSRHCLVRTKDLQGKVLGFWHTSIHFTLAAFKQTSRRTCPASRRPSSKSRWTVQTPGETANGHVRSCPHWAPIWGGCSAK